MDSEAKIKSGVDIVVGTPGRISDFLERRTLDLRELKHVVVDEVDRMLDMGFADSVDEILRHRYRHSMQYCLICWSCACNKQMITSVLLIYQFSILLLYYSRQITN